MVAYVNRIMAYSYKSDTTEDAKIALQARIISLKADCKKDGKSYIAGVMAGPSKESDVSPLPRYDILRASKSNCRT